MKPNDLLRCYLWFEIGLGAIGIVALIVVLMFGL